MSNVVIIAVLYVLPVVIIKPIHFYVLVDGLIRNGLSLLTFVVILVVSAKISRRRFAQQGHKLKLITRLLMAALAVVFVQITVWLLGIDVDSTRSVNFGNLSQIDRIDVTVVGSRNTTTITDKNIIKELSQIADTNRSGYYETVDITVFYTTFSIRFYSKGHGLASLGVGDGLLTGSSFTYKYVSTDLTNKIRQLAGLP